MEENPADSDAASRWAGWALAHSEFGSSVNPITTRGTDYAHHITVCPPRFENLAASLTSILMCLFSLHLTTYLFSHFLSGYCVNLVIQKSQV